MFITEFLDKSSIHPSLFAPKNFLFDDEQRQQAAGEVDKVLKVMRNFSSLLGMQFGMNIK